MAKTTAEELKFPTSDKLKALQLAMDKIEKDHGKGTIMRMGDTKVEDVSFISSGSIGLNVALGVGGYPRGRVIEIYGPESSGKTTLAIHAIAEAQKAGGSADRRDEARQGAAANVRRPDAVLRAEAHAAANGGRREEEG